MERFMSGLHTVILRPGTGLVEQALNAAASLL